MQNRSVAMPGRYSGEIAIMQEMGWSWPDLCAAPADLVEEIAYRMERRLHWQEQREKLDAAKRKAHGR